MLRARRSSPVDLDRLVVALESQWTGIAALARGLETREAAVAGMQGQLDALLDRVRALETG